jgi:hypothetical protein
MHSMASDLKLRWYLGLMRPHPNGDWILLRDLYTDARAFNDLLNDLSEPFRSDDTDLVGVRTRTARNHTLRPNG